jgi:hypothetical protein
MNTMLIVIAILAALVLLGALAVTVIAIAPQAEAGCERGKAINQALQKSDGRCFDRGTF